MRWLPVLIFTVVLSAHFWLESNPAPLTSAGWASYDFKEPEPSRLTTYLTSGSYWLGLSYAMAAAFATWCFLRMLRLPRRAIASSAAGFTLSGILVAGACFLSGCCGSPMLPLYLGLFGSRFLGITKPITLGITVLAILVGYAWMQKKAPAAP